MPVTRDVQALASESRRPGDSYRAAPVCVTHKKGAATTPQASTAYDRLIDTPPSTSIAVPVVNDEASVAR